MLDLLREIGAIDGTGSTAGTLMIAVPCDSLAIISIPSASCMTRLPAAVPGPITCRYHSTRAVVWVCSGIHCDQSERTVRGQASQVG